VDIFMVDI